MVSKILSWLFPIKAIEIKIDSIELKRREQREQIRFWGGKSPESGHNFSGEDIHVMAEGVANRIFKGEHPRPVGRIENGMFTSWHVPAIKKP